MDKFGVQSIKMLIQRCWKMFGPADKVVIDYNDGAYHGEANRSPLHPAEIHPLVSTVPTANNPLPCQSEDIWAKIEK